jgi:hypothetical protein
MPEDSPSFSDTIDEVLCRLTPQLLHEYELLKQEHKAKLAEEQQHLKSAQRFLRIRKASREGFVKLRQESETEIRRLKKEFAANIRALLERFGCTDC